MLIVNRLHLPPRAPVARSKPTRFREGHDFSRARRDLHAETAARMQRMAATVESNPPRLPDLWTIAAIAVCATVIADFIHEGLGHGGMCVATGGQPLVLSTVHFECSADTRLVAAGGTL